MWLAEYINFSPVRTNQRLRQLRLFERHFIRYPWRIIFVGSFGALVRPRDGDVAIGTGEVESGNASSDSDSDVTG